MKVTALLPDKLVSEVKQFTRGKTITDSLIIALQEWVSLKHIKELNKTIESYPLEFTDDFSAENIREINRQR